jgi:hypothetical protein
LTFAHVQAQLNLPNMLTDEIGEAAADSCDDGDGASETMPGDADESRLPLSMRVSLDDII